MSNFHDNNTNYSNYNGYPNNSNNPNDFSGGGNRNGRRSNAVVIVSIALVMLILGGLLGVVIVQGMNSQQAQLGSEVTATPEATATPAPTQQAQAVSGGATTSLAALSNQIADVVASVQDSVVGIHNYQTVTTGGNYGGYFGGFYFPYYGGGDSEPQTVEQLAGSGSGVIYSADGYIITNYHVIEGASRVTVVLHSGEEIEAEVIGGDELQDIALLKVDRTDLSPATLGDSDQVRTGEFAIAIGSPLGDELSGTTTYGIISYANRTLEVDGAYLSMIQTDAAINAGNSGGPLLHEDGYVIGIATMKMDDTEGINGAIRIEVAKSAELDTQQRELTLCLTDSPDLRVGPDLYLKANVSWHNMLPRPATTKQWSTYNAFIESEASSGSSSTEAYSQAGHQLLLDIFGWEVFPDWGPDYSYYIDAWRARAQAWYDEWKAANPGQKRIHESGSMKGREVTIRTK